MLVRVTAAMDAERRTNYAQSFRNFQQRRVRQPLRTNPFALPPKHRFSKGASTKNQQCCPICRLSRGPGRYPLKEGQPDCDFYMRKGECKFGPTCKFNHPEKVRCMVWHTPTLHMWLSWVLRSCGTTNAGSILACSVCRQEWCRPNPTIQGNTNRVA